MTTIDQVEIPSLTLVEGSAPPNAPSGDQTLFLDVADHKLKRKDSTGSITDIEAGGGGGGSGDLILLEQHTAAGSAQLDFTSFISSTYDEYLIELLNIVPSADAQLWLRMGTGGGPTYDAGNNYTHATLVWNASGIANFGANAVAEIILNYSNAGDGITASGIANWSYNGSIRLFNPGGSTFKFISGQALYVDSNGLNRSTVQIMGSYEVTTAVTALRFLMSTGNIASGHIRIYGLTH